MTTLPDINLLTGKQIEEVLKTCDSYLGKKLGLEGAVENTKLPVVVSSLNITWNSIENFEKDINLLAKENNIRSAYATLYKIWEQKLAQEKSEKVEKTTLTPEEAEKLEAEARKREQQRVQSAAKSQKDVEQFIKQQKSIAEEAKKAKETLKDKKVYVKVAQPEPTKLTPDELKAYKNLQSMAQETPHILVKNITKTIEEKLPESFRGGATPEEIHHYAESVAVRAVDNLRAGPKPLDKDPVVLAHLSNHPEVLDKAGVSATDKKFITKAASDLSTLKMLPYRATSEILHTVFGKNVTEQILGPDPTTLSVTFTDQPQEATNTVSLDKLAENYQTAAESPFFSQIQSFGVDEIKGKLIDYGKEKVLEQIGKFPADSFFGKITASEKFSGILNLLKPAQTIEATNLFGKLVMNFSPEFAPVVSGIGQLIGVDFGLISVPATAAVTPIVIPIEAVAIEGVATTTPVVTAAAGEVAKKGIGTAIGTAILKGASSLAAKVGLTGLSTQIGALIGTPFGGFIGAAIGAFVGWVAGKVIEPILVWIKKHQEDLKIVGLITLGGGAIMRSLPLMIFGGLVFAPIALRSGFSMAGIAARTTFFFGRIGKSMAITIGTPIIVAIVVFPILVAIILFIINSGAYLVPPSATSYLLGYDNPYMSVTKVANPDKIGNPSGTQTVIYTVTITALKGTLTDVKILSTSCNVIKKDKSNVSCPVENIPDIPPDLSISPTSPHSFTFPSEFGSSLSDSLVFDSIKIGANAAEKQGISTSGSETVCVGDCPLDCIKVADNALPWPGNLRSNVEGAAASLSSKYPGFVAKVCSSGEVNLCYNPPQISPGSYAWHVHNAFGNECDVYFNEKGVGSTGNALFMITHELNHHVQRINGGSTQEYVDSGAFAELGSSGFCTYSSTAGSEIESMAEASGLYASIPSWGGCVTNYKNQYPKNYTFAKNFME